MSSLPAQPRPQSSMGLRLYDRLKYDLDHDPKVSQEVALGKRVGMYRLRGHLGAGNFAKVKLGLHLITHEKVAIKIIDKTKLDDQARKLLSREILCMETLDHPNIIRLYEVIESFSKLHLVMEVAGDGDLQSQIIKEGAMTENWARPIFAQITAAIQYMHQKGIIHRDLKAENVFFASSNTIKVGDFGFSTQSQADTLLDTFCGSPPYASPELFSEESYSGQLVDIWAMGVTLYFMLSATLPFKGDNIPELKAAIQGGKYVPLEKTSKSCQALVKGLLEVDPKKRWSWDDVCSCDNWLTTGRDYCPNNTTTAKEDTFKSDFGTLVNENVLNELQKLGAPTTNHGMFCGEPRNSVAGAYRILLHRRAIAGVGKDHESQRLHSYHMIAQSADTPITNKLNKRNSKFCAIL